jgi:pSer/pThr/pTyr-binding forkhead associated (FHA) protein
MPSLILITEDYPRQVFELGRAILMVGRSDDSEIKVPDHGVSRNHASIVMDQGSFVVRDNGSLNGTYVNGERVSRYILKHHDMVRFGSCLFLVDLKDQRRGPSGTAMIHTGSKGGREIELTPKSLIPGSPVKPVKLVLSSGAPRRKSKPLPPMTAR